MPVIRFIWDTKKAEANIRKHNISFSEAKSVFYDKCAIQFFDDAHSASEDRFIMLGMSRESRVLLVCHCARDDGETIRIISARKATKSERKFYRGE